jgi:hypothetical protein
MTTITDDEAAAMLQGAAKAWAETLRPAVRAIDGLSDRPHSRPVREALVLAAEHVRIAAMLLEATAEAAEPHRSEQAHQLDEDALRRRIRDAAL